MRVLTRINKYEFSRLLQNLIICYHLAMNKVTIPINYPLRGELTIPADKSVSHRAVMISSLIKGNTLIKGFSKAQDPLSTVEVCRKLGVEITKTDERTLLVKSTGVLSKPNCYLNCGNSGTTMRLMSGILAGQDFKSMLIGDESLSNRPMKRVIEPLTQMGAVIHSTNNLAPLCIDGQRLHGITYRSKLSTAQVKSCVLLAGMFAEGVTTYVEPSLSRNHTELMLSYLGADINVDGLSVTIKPSTLEPKDIEVVGDISSAAFYIVAGLIVPNSDIILKNVGLNPTRTGILKVIEQMGGDIEILDERTVCNEVVGDIRVRYSELKGTTIEGDIIPKLIDELPIIAVLATQAEGETVIKNAEDLRNKECDRVSAVTTMLKNLGADIEETPDGFIICGKTKLSGGVDVETFKDHRLAMSAYVAGLVCEKPVSIKSFNCVDISLPEFEYGFANLKM